MSIKKEIFKGVKYTAIAQYSNVFANLFIGGVLARLLSPAEYGTVALVTVFVTFFGMLSDIGLSSGITQFKDLTKSQIASLFNLSVILGIALASIFWIASYWIAQFYNNQVYISIGHVLSITILFRAASAVPAGLLTREKRFKEIGLLTVFVSIFTGIIGVALAFHGFSYWALIYRITIGSVLIFLGNVILSRVPISLSFRLTGMSALIRYSGFSFLFNFVNYFSRNLDNLLIGKYLGAAPLGFYDKAYTLMKLPLDNLMTVITPVLHPVLSGHANNKAQTVQVHLRLSKLMAMLGIPISVYLFYCRYEVIHIIYGKQWAESAEPFKWLAFSIWIQMILSSNGAFFMVEGKTNYQFLTGLLSAFTIIVAVVAGVNIGSIEIVAFFILLAFIVNLLQGYFLLCRYVLFIPYSTLFKTLMNPFIIGIICFICMLPFNFYSFELFESLILKTFTFCCSLLIGFFITKEFRWAIKSLRNTGLFIRK